MKYQVLRTDVAESQLTDILQYITRLTGDTASALSLLDELEAAQKQLEDFPKSGINPRYLAIRRCGYRFLIIKNHYLFYKVNHGKKTVTIYAIIYCRADYKHLL